MTEPLHTATGSVSLVTLAVAVFGPEFGPYVVIVLGSIGGGLWALSSAELGGLLAGLWLMVRCVLTAVVLTALIATAVATWFGVAATEAYAAVAFVIGAFGNKWLEVFESIKNRLLALISTAGGKP